MYQFNFEEKSLDKKAEKLDTFAKVGSVYEPTLDRIYNTGGLLEKHDIVTDNC